MNFKGIPESHSKFMCVRVHVHSSPGSIYWVIKAEFTCHRDEIFVHPTREGACDPSVIRSELPAHLLRGWNGIWSRKQAPVYL